MNAMILAAGRGERLRPLTDHTPKPLVSVQGQPVIAHTLARLARLGAKKVVINACHLAEKLVHYVGDGSTWGVHVQWSLEEKCLDTGGGVVHALHHMGTTPFLVINGDILWDMDLRPLLATFDPKTMGGLLGVVETPPNERRDFLFSTKTGQLQRAAHGLPNRPMNEDQKGVTYSGIQVLRPQALAHYPDEPFSLNRFYDDALQAGQLRGLRLHGQWADMGTPERLKKVRKMGWTSGTL